MTGATSGYRGSSGSAAPPIHRDPEVWAPRLARILDRQYALYERLESLGASQAGLIERDETDRLLEVLGQRQQLIEEIAAANEEVHPYAKDWERLAPLLPEKLRLLLRERFDAVSKLVDSICHRDEKDRQQLERRRTQIGDELSGLSRSRGAVTAYGRTGSDDAPSRYQDTQG